MIDAARTDAGPPRSTLSTTRLWFGALGGHAAWSAQLLLSYLVVSLACLVQPESVQVLGVDVFQLLLVLLTVLPAAVAAAAAVVGFRAWRAARGDRRAEGGGTGGWRGFMGLFGALLSGLFVGVILLTGVSLLFLPLCD